uniref:ZN692 protein n=1 Tax=Gopherus agassizii TaxID=38772 RepID=A0A452GMX3_9SAUR
RASSPSQPKICKKRKQSLDRRRGKTRIYVGNHIDRWLTLKEKLDFRNDAEVAGFLLDLPVFPASLGV